MIYHLHLPLTSDKTLLKIELFISANRSGKSGKCHRYVDGCSNCSSPQLSHCSVSLHHMLFHLAYFLQLRQPKTSANISFFRTDTKNKILN